MKCAHIALERFPLWGSIGFRSGVSSTHRCKNIFLLFHHEKGAELISDGFTCLKRKPSRCVLLEDHTIVEGQLEKIFFHHGPSPKKSCQICYWIKVIIYNTTKMWKFEESQTPLWRHWMTTCPSMLIRLGWHCSHHHLFLSRKRLTVLLWKWLRRSMAQKTRSSRLNARDECSSSPSADTIG